MPRAQSTYADLPGRLALGWDSDLRRHLKIDIVIQGVPDRTVFVARKSNGALDGFRRHSAFDFEMQIDLQKPMRILLGALPGEPGTQRLQGCRPFRRMKTTSADMQPASANASA